MVSKYILRNERSRAKAGHIYYRIIWYGRMYGIFIKIIYTPSHMYTNENVQPVLYGTRCEVKRSEFSFLSVPAIILCCVHTSLDSVNNYHIQVHDDLFKGIPYLASVAIVWRIFSKESILRIVNALRYFLHTSERHHVRTYYILLCLVPRHIYL